MPLFLSAFLGGLLSVATSLVGRVLLALGVGVLTFTGVSAVLSDVQAQVVLVYNNAPPVWIAILYLLKVDICTSIAFSAITARLSIMGLTSGAFSRMVVKP